MVFKSKLLARLEKLENYIGEPKKKEEKVDKGLLSLFDYSLWDMWNGGLYESTLTRKYESLKEKHESLRKDFQELGNKFSKLERFLQIEFTKQDTETQTYGWSDKRHEEGFRKAPVSYEKMKEEKEKPNCSPCDCDD